MHKLFLVHAKHKKGTSSNIKMSANGLPMLICTNVITSVKKIGQSKRLHMQSQLGAFTHHLSNVLFVAAWLHQ